jgi:hypothetical protein
MKQAYTLEELNTMYGKNNVVPSLRCVNKYNVKMSDPRYEVDTMVAYEFIAIFAPRSRMPIAQYTLAELLYDGTVKYSEEDKGAEELMSSDLWTRKSVREYR